MAPEIVEYNLRRVWVNEVTDGQIMAPEISEPIELSKAQFETYTFIVKHFAERGYVPKVRRIMGHRGEKSTSAVSRRLRRLEELGCISCEYNENDILVNYSPLLLEDQYQLKAQTNSRSRSSLASEE